MKIIIIAEMSDELIQNWLQHVRNFDVANAGKIKFQILAHDPKMTSDELMQKLNINPPLPFKKVIKHN